MRSTGLRPRVDWSFRDGVDWALLLWYRNGVVHRPPVSSLACYDPSVGLLHPLELMPLQLSTILSSIAAAHIIGAHIIKAVAITAISIGPISTFAAAATTITAVSFTASRAAVDSEPSCWPPLPSRPLHPALALIQARRRASWRRHAWHERRRIKQFYWPRGWIFKPIFTTDGLRLNSDYFMEQQGGIYWRLAPPSSTSSPLIEAAAAAKEVYLNPSSPSYCQAATSSHGKPCVPLRPHFRHALSHAHRAQDVKLFRSNGSARMTYATVQNAVALMLTELTDNVTSAASIFVEVCICLIPVFV